MVKIKKGNSLIVAALTTTLLVGASLVIVEIKSKGNSISSEFKKTNDELTKETYTFQTFEGKQGLMDGAGKVVVKANYEEIYPFEENLAIFKEENKYGAINKEGEIVLNGEYRSLRQLGEGYILAIKEEGATNYVYNIDGELIFSLDNLLNIGYMGKDLFAVTNKDSETAVISKDNEFIIPYTSNMMVGGVSDEFFIKITLIPSLNGGLTQYTSELMKYDGQLLTDEVFEGIAKIDNDIVLTMKNNKLGAIDKDGNNIINYKFDELDFLNKENLRVRIGDKFGVINKKGEVFIEPKYEEIFIFNSDLNKECIVAKSNRKFGIVDLNDNIKIPFEYDNIKLISNGLIMLQKGKEVSFVNKENKVIIPLFICDDIFIQNNVARVFIDNGMYFLNLNNKGEVIGDMKFDDFYAPNFNLIEAIYNNEIKYYINTETGKIIYKTKLNK